METEITKKIRTAIENKLIEYDAFVDKELPEYIMVMVANKKTKEQMDDDLSLFLGKKVGKFTSWLLKMLQFEKQGGDTVKSTKTSDGAAINHPSDEDDILALDAQEQETDEFLKNELLEDGGISIQSKPEMPLVEEEEEPTSEVKTSVAIHDGAKDTGRVTAKDVFQKQSEALVKSPATRKRIPSKSSVISSSVKIPAATEEQESEYDPLNPSIGVKSVASKVLTPEKKFGLPHSSQANGLMLLKAVNEANKSVLSEKKLEEVYNPTPIKVLVSHHGNHYGQQSKSGNREYKPSPIVKTVYKYDDNEEEKKEYVPQPYASWSLKSFNISKEPMCGDYIPETVARKVICKTKDIIPDDFYRPNMAPYNGVLKVKPDPRPISPHFVVTLDGYDSKSRKRSLFSVSQSEESDKEDIENMDIPLSPDCFDEPTAKKSKPLERCRFWPACKNGDTCDFHHPTTPCKTFPNCKFGDKCFYVHPKCKFDVLCTRKDCPYIHTCKKEFPVSKKPQISVRSPYPVKFVPIPPPQAFSSGSTQCKFFPNCTAFKCPYFHPKPCRYGADCQSPSCTFIHPMFPSPNQLKWKAESI